jgi:hypothetical protein
MFTDELINQLITEEKIITEPPKKEPKLENQHFRNEFQLSSHGWEKTIYSFYKTA